MDPRLVDDPGAVLHEALAEDMAAEGLSDIDDPAPVGDPEQGSEQSRSDARERLVNIAGAAELFHTPGGVPYATYAVGDHRETSALKGPRFKDWLCQHYYRSEGHVPKALHLTDAMTTIAGIAQYDGLEREVYVRVAPIDGGLVLDLGNETWEAVVVTAQGWQIVSDPPVRFRRPASMAPLPAPVRGGSVDLLRNFVNVVDDDAWRLVVGWLVAAFNPRGPYPVLILHGEQGSAKSTSERLIRSVIDPNESPLRAAPKDQDDLVVAAKNGLILAFDNLSAIQDWFSDALCRVAVGAGLAKRMLYTDQDEVVLQACRPIMINGINELATRGDLLDRSILVDLDPIAEDARRPEQELISDFQLFRPAILGALLDAVAGAFARLPTLARPDRLPRMADAALFVTAAEETLGWKPGSFLAAYEANRERANDLALEASPVGPAIRALVEAHGKWRGTPTDLKNELVRYTPDDVVRSARWPNSAWGLSQRLDRLAPNLRATGVGVYRQRKAHDRLITLWLIEDHGLQPPRDEDDAGDEAPPPLKAQD